MGECKAAKHFILELLAVAMEKMYSKFGSSAFFQKPVNNIPEFQMVETLYC